MQEVVTSLRVDVTTIKEAQSEKNTGKDLLVED